VVFRDEEIGQLLSPDFLQAVGFSKKINVYGELLPKLTAMDSLNKNLEIDQLELLPNQVLPFVDRLSMAHSIEVRCPYLDYRIIEFANSLPGRYKIKNGVVKYTHKKAVKDLLPEELINRPKEGFVQPIYAWMHGELRNWIGSQLDSLPVAIFNKEYVRTLKRGYLLGDRELYAKIWNIVCFGMWYKALSA
jgi:asparagine synthase (glutamine-hydrolysing)